MSSAAATHTPGHTFQIILAFTFVVVVTLPMPIFAVYGTLTLFLVVTAFRASINSATGILRTFDRT